MQRDKTIPIGKKFGRLTVISDAGVVAIGARQTTVRMVKCICTCGNFKIAQLHNIKAGKTASCGCIAIEHARRVGKIQAEKNKTHGDYKSPEYRAWISMHQRCRRNTPHAQNKKYYSDRGVTICKRWYKYVNFLADMGRRPTSAHSLDKDIKIRGNIKYCKRACMWATPVEQASARRSVVDSDSD